LHKVNFLSVSFSLICSVLLSSVAYAKTIHLLIPIVNESAKQHLYFHELLTTAITEAGHTPKLTTWELPQPRIKAYMRSGEISIYWMLETAEINQKYSPIETNITNGLIGKRILFIKKGTQPLYNRVKTLEDFRKLNLVGGMGTGWFDSKVWKANDLQYQEHSGNWKSIFRMIPKGRTYHYFSRGINEILIEAKEHTELEIEKKLLLIYNRDFRFYLSKAGPHAGAKYHAILTLVMKKAKDSGLINRLTKKYWADDFETLNYDKRIKIFLKTPKME